MPIPDVVGGPDGPLSEMQRVLHEQHAANAAAETQAELEKVKELEQRKQQGPVPTAGRIVLYRSYGSPGGEYKSKPIAAVVTEVEYANEVEPGKQPVPTGRVGLCIFNPTGLFFKSLADGGCEYGALPGQWQWPPRV